ncbi:hypothetical protein [Mycolicibacterium sp. 018/SC-01/001]|uniref:hypothetical protein n=1 Tax=Mycolicibacterium sp. 018/SC-01/001 TaxID=2592069 RepID=UPI00163D74C6|nr:hypothetical protein [Mycolicibacterium sp. 018/SC-01/001]
MEGREVPEEHVRSAAAEKYLEEIAAQRRTARLLDVLKSEIWPLLSDAAKDHERSHWDYRVVRSLDCSEYFIAEVYYDGDKVSWVDDSRNALRWDRYDDLKGTVDLIQQAFDKPLLQVTADDHLEEVTPD